MRKALVGSIICVLVLIGIVAYGSRATIDFLSSGNFIINGKFNENPIINYNGNVYVPIRFIAENMAANITYEAGKTISIEQTSVRFDELVSAPVPYVAYVRNFKDGRTWLQDIPLLQGNSCWSSCYHAPKPLSKFLAENEYPPVIVKPGSTLIIKYPQGMEPKQLDVLMGASLVDREEDYKEIKLDKGRLFLPENPGEYNILMNAIWDHGDTSYIFAVTIL
ncbi:copper amine oxidase [Paenibacillus sp. SYP-B3998]|uniref:stalk domain-containing protein n=1 Tax=Paenibacillus sp. SYP-B3998 TaxID=2678564 RepID=UPI001968241B|nr:copper amine oxidase [Paenibacillus sp. SYP-B3998]